MNFKFPQPAKIARYIFVMLALAAFPASARDVPQIVVFGDSLVAGYQLPQGKGFPDQLQAALDAQGIEAKIIGAGVSGDTTSSGLSRIDWSVPDGTDLVIVELGANDALRGLPPETTAKNLDAIVRRLKERNIGILLAGMLAPPNMGEDYANAFNPIYGDLAEKYDLSLYPFFLEGIAARQEYNLEDGMHPNAKGVGIIVAGILPLVVAALKHSHEHKD